MIIMSALLIAFCPDSMQASETPIATTVGDAWKYDLLAVRALNKKYPDADAVILHHAVRITLDDRGLATRTVSRRVALFTDDAIRRYADPRILYDAGRQELEISVARVYMRDGSRIDSGENAFNRTTPFAFSQAPDYTDWQEMVVTHVGVEKDCVAELVYTIRDTKPLRPWLSGVEYLAQEDPALSGGLTIAVPPGVHLKYACINGAPEPIRGGENEYTWKLENIPCERRIAGGLWWGDYVPAVVYSTAADWDVVADYFADEFSDKAAITGDIEQKIENGDEESILELHKKCIECVRNIDPPFAPFASMARNAGQIYQSAYAHAWDHAILLGARLKQNGIRVTPVLVSAGRNWSDDVAAPEWCRGILLEVLPSDSGKSLLLNPEKEYLHDARFMHAGHVLVRCGTRAKIDRVAECAPEDNISSLAVTLSLAGVGKIQGEGTVSMRGAFSPYYSVRGVENETESFLKKRVADLFPSCELKSWNIRTLREAWVEIGFLFEAEMPEATEQKRIYLSLPNAFDEEINGLSDLHVERSAYPAPVCILPCRLQVEVAIDDMGDYSLIGDVPQADDSNSVGGVKRSVQRSVSKDDAEITITKMLTISKAIVPAEEYGMLRSLLLAYREGAMIFSSNGRD